MPEPKFTVEKVPDKNGEIEMSEKEKILAEIEVEKLKKEREAQKLDFASFAEYLKHKKDLELKEIELINREATIQEREKIVDERERQVVAAGERNEAVKKGLISKEIQDYKKAEAVRAYAFQTYFTALDQLFQKLLNGKSGKSCMGLIQRGKKTVDETCVIDEDWREELKPLIKTIQVALKHSPKFSTEGEYLTNDEVLPEDDELEEEAE